MNNHRFTYLRLDISLALLSASVIGYQIVLMQLLSIQQWHYMAFLIISIALLAFGTSGTIFTIFKNYLLKHFYKSYAMFLKACCIFMAIIPILVNTSLLQFDTYLLFIDPKHILKFTITCLLFFIPFLFAAMAIILAFSKHSSRIGKLYFANLCGSATGGIIALIIMYAEFPHQLSSIIAAICWCAVVVLKYAPSPKTYISNFIILPAFIFCCYFYASPVKSSEYKSISKILNLPEAKILEQENTPFGFTQLICSPALRYAPSVTLINTEPIPRANILFVNGEIAGYIPKDSSSIFNILNKTPMALPFHINKDNKTLVLQSGTGEYIHMALSMNANHIIALEENPTLLLYNKKSVPRSFQKQLYYIHSSTRSFFKRDDSSYDIILFPNVGSYFGSAGLYAMQEQNWLTVEAFNEAWNHLNNNGILCISCWMDYPYRKPLRLTASLYEMLLSNNISNPNHYIISIKNWNLISFFVKRSPYTQKDLTTTRTFCDSLLFDMVLPATNNYNQSNYFHQTNDSLFYRYLTKLTSASKDGLYQTYPYRINPTTDNKPYFSQFLKTSSLLTFTKNLQLQNIPYFELGYFIVVLTFILVVLMGLIFIILPIVMVRRFTISGKNFIYFAAIGLGYMLVEMVFIHQFNIYFSNTLYSVICIISALLLTSGIGSYVSDKKPFCGFGIIPLTIAIILLFHILFLPTIIDATIHLGFLLRLFICIISVGITGFFMGFPFPSAIRKLSDIDANQIPAAWSINGLFSVIAVPCAVILSVESGFNSLFIVAMVSYTVAALVVFKAKIV